MANQYSKKPLVVTPTCPFCGGAVAPPRDTDSPGSGEMPGGVCSCGAVYVSDVTGHNLGTALVEALVWSCGGDWDRAWNLSGETDYDEGRVERYDLENHVVVPGGFLEGRRIAGVLFFVRLKAAGSVKLRTTTPLQREEETRQTRAASVRRERKKKTYTRRDIETLVNRYDREALLEIARNDKRVIRDLQRLLYSGDILLRRRAADLLGAVSSLIADRDSKVVAGLLQRLLTSVTDSAASSWGAVDAVGEIIRNRPDLYAAYLPPLVGLLRDSELRAGVLWSLGRIAEAAPHLLESIGYRFLPMVRDPDAGTRAFAVRLLGFLGVKEAKSEFERLREDEEPVEVYQAGELVTSSVGGLAAEAVHRIECVNT